MCGRDGYSQYGRRGTCAVGRVRLPDIDPITKAHGVCDVGVDDSDVADVVIASGGAAVRNDNINEYRGWAKKVSCCTM